MSVSPEEFKNVMSHVAATVTVVTANSDEGPIGLTVSAFMSVSADPAIVLICVDKSTASLQPMLDAPGYTVNVMPVGTEDEAMVVATHGADKFGSTSWNGPSIPEAGPVLESALASLECVTIDRSEVGDHWVIYGEVDQVTIAKDDIAPLMWHGRVFVQIEE